MKVISIYELLGLIKDGKAPKKIRYGLTEWIYDDDAKDYFKGEDNVVSLQMTYVSNPKWLNLEIEIMEDEFVDIEEFNIDTFHDIGELTYKINDLIKNQKKIIEKLKEEGK